MNGIRVWLKAFQRIRIDKMRAMGFLLGANGWSGLVSEPVKIQWKKDRDLTGGLLNMVCAAYEVEKKSLVPSKSKSTGFSPLHASCLFVSAETPSTKPGFHSSRNHRIIIMLCERPVNAVRKRGEIVVYMERCFFAGLLLPYSSSESSPSVSPPSSDTDAWSSSASPSDSKSASERASCSCACAGGEWLID